MIARLSVVLTTALIASGVFATAAAAQDVVHGSERSPLLLQVSGGCGPNGWRGRWGHCRWHHEGGRGYGFYVAGPYRYPAGPFWNRQCPPGFWRGPWGHCRDTPYHGNLPDGGYKP